MVGLLRIEPHWAEQIQALAVVHTELLSSIPSGKATADCRGGPARHGEGIPAHGGFLQRGDFPDASGPRGGVAASPMTLALVTWMPSITEEEETLVHNPWARFAGSLR